MWPVKEVCRFTQRWKKLLPSWRSEVVALHRSLRPQVRPNLVTKKFPDYCTSHELGFFYSFQHLGWRFSDVPASPLSTPPFLLPPSPFYVWTPLATLILCFNLSSAGCVFLIEQPDCCHSRNVCSASVVYLRAKHIVGGMSNQYDTVN